jgi:hypothetical protein
MGWVALSPNKFGPWVKHEDYAALEQENERLIGCLKKANEQTEHFEREWYLRGDELEKLKQPVSDEGL